MNDASSKQELFKELLGKDALELTVLERKLVDLLVTEREKHHHELLKLESSSTQIIQELSKKYSECQVELTHLRKRIAENSDILEQLAAQRAADEHVKHGEF